MAPTCCIRASDILARPSPPLLNKPLNLQYRCHLEACLSVFQAHIFHGSMFSPLVHVSTQ